MDRKGPSYKSRPPLSKPAGPSCVICFKTQTILSVGACDHPVCFECSTTMRVLCDQKECPICRRILLKVIFTKELDLFKNLDNRQYSRYNKKYGIAFDDHSIEHSFENLMLCYCKKCYDRPDFTFFEQLVTHMEKQHRLYACRLCVKHLKIFPSQRRWYNCDELARHEECGDPDNTSHRGHPACHFCNVRYLDKDELYKHLRKDHLYCHFCDADGIQDYYMSYDWLRKHYHDKHYLCEEGDCINEQFTSVFRTSIDLQAHKAQTHSKELGKHGSKEARTLKLEFNLRPRNNPLIEATRPNHYQPPRTNVYNAATNLPDRTVNVRDTSDFPSLNGQPTTVLPCARSRKQNQSVNTRDLNSFPALGQEPAPLPKPQKSTNSIRMAAVLKKPAEQPKPARNKDTTGAGPSGLRLPNQAKDFPSLDGNQPLNKGAKENAVTVSTSTANSGSSWVSKAKTANLNGQDEKKKAKKEPAAIKKKIAEAPKVPGPSDFPNLNKKLEPTKSNLAKLGNKKKTENAKKSSPVENSNNNNNNPNGKKIATSTPTENSNPKKVADHSKSVDNIKENNKPKPKSTETQNNSNDVTKLCGKTEMIANNINNLKVPVTDPKKEVSKKKESSALIPLPDKPEDNLVDTNIKDKKKRKKNENKEPLASSTVMVNSQENNHSKTNTPKVPPGFENSFHHTVRAPPGLTAGISNRPVQALMKAPPPGLSLTTNNCNSGKPTFEYVHPVASTLRNKMLINNLTAALIPFGNEGFDTFEKFKEMSTLFRKHLITAFDFYSYCVEALCPNSFETVFMELVLLLPDIQKQQELLFIYNRNSRKEMNVEVCKYCFQVLRINDMESHLSVHNTTNS